MKSKNKPFKFGFINFVYSVLMILVIIVFLSVFKIDQLYNCATIDKNDDYRNIGENIYVPKYFGEDEIEVVFSYLDVAKKRNTELFGSVEGHPVIIFTDDVLEAVDYYRAQRI
jgi:hypothetical protein